MITSLITSGDYIEIVRALSRTRPIKGMHSGRGGLHSERCYQTCYESWLMDCRTLANVLQYIVPAFDREKFLGALKGELPYPMED